MSPASSLPSFCRHEKSHFTANSQQMPGECKHLQPGQEMGERKLRYVSLITLSLLRLVSNAPFTHISMMMFYLPCNLTVFCLTAESNFAGPSMRSFHIPPCPSKTWSPGGIRTLCLKPIPPQCNYALQQQDWQNKILKILQYQYLSSCCSNKQFCTELLSITAGDALTPWVIHSSFPKIYI